MCSDCWIFVCLHVFHIDTLQPIICFSSKMKAGIKRKWGRKKNQHLTAENFHKKSLFSNCLNLMSARSLLNAQIVSMYSVHKQISDQLALASLVPSQKHESSILSSWLPFIMNDFRFPTALLKKHLDKDLKWPLRLPKLIIDLSSF